VASLKSFASDGLTGEPVIPGDKSISHRALMLGASAVGETKIRGLLEAGDIMATAGALRLLGAEIERSEGDPPIWRVWGRGTGGLAEPSTVLDLGNAGTGARLLMGLLASHPFTSVLTGDASLRARPMKRVIDPLIRMGANFTARQGGRLPVTVNGTDQLLPGHEILQVASAQVKSAILLAGLNTNGKTTVVEPRPSRDHTELLLRHFGAEIEMIDEADGRRRITITGYPELKGAEVTVPADISSAAFPMVGALLVPGSKVMLRRVGINPLRSGLLQTLEEMGGKIEISSSQDQGGEAYADLAVEHGPLSGVTVPAGRAPSMIDEYPILAMAAACADGPTRFEGVGELRVKESDRLSAIAEGLEACGVRVEEGEDSLVIHGIGAAPKGGALVQSKLDHRIAMSFLMLGAATVEPISIDDDEPIGTSYPGFVDMMNGIGARIETGEAAS